MEHRWDSVVARDTGNRIGFKTEHPWQNWERKNKYGKLVWKERNSKHLLVTSRMTAWPTTAPLVSEAKPLYLQSYITISDFSVEQNPMSFPFTLSCLSTAGEISTCKDKQWCRDQASVTLFPSVQETEGSASKTLVFYQVTYMEAGSTAEGIAGGRWGEIGHKSVGTQYSFVLLLIEQCNYLGRHL